MCLHVLPGHEQQLSYLILDCVVQVVNDEGRLLPAPVSLQGVLAKVRTIKPGTVHYDFRHPHVGEAEADHQCYLPCSSGSSIHPDCPSAPVALPWQS